LAKPASALPQKRASSTCAPSLAKKPFQGPVLSSGPSKVFLPTRPTLAAGAPILHRRQPAPPASLLGSSGVLPANPIMRHRLREQLPAWQELGCSSLVLGWIAEGFPLWWKGPVPPSHSASNHQSAVKNADFVTQSVKEMIANKAVELVQERPTVVSPLGVVPKPGSGKLRLIWDGRFVNQFVRIPDLSYESLGTLHSILDAHDWMFTLDLKNGYHHLDIHPDFWTYLGFEWQGAFYVYTQLPFGLAPACWAFSRLTRDVLGAFKRVGIANSGYIDDSVYANKDKDLLVKQQHRVLDTWQNLGFIVNMEKSQLKPSQQVKYLGMYIDTVAGTFFVPAEKRAKFIKACTDLLAALHDPVPVKALASVKGQLLSFAWAFGSVPVRIFSRQLDLNIVAATSWSADVRLSQPCRDELLFWIEIFSQFDGLARIWRPVSWEVQIYTDAAGKDPVNMGGWGAWTLIKGTKLVAGGRWTSFESDRSSTWQELQAILNSLKAYNGPDHALANKNILLYTDSLNAALSINKGSSRSADCIRVRQALFWFCLQHDICLEAVWVPRELNEEADALSKTEDPTDIMLDPSIFADLEQQWGPFCLDLFASSVSTQLGSFYSRLYTPGAAGVNAFAYEWNSGTYWAYPPFSLVRQVIKHAQLCKARLVLVCPAWCYTPWWRLLTNNSPTHFAPMVHSLCVLPKAAGVFLNPVSRKALPRQNWTALALLLDFGSPTCVLQPIPDFLRRPIY
jgi:ribonuclease HI